MDAKVDEAGNRSATLKADGKPVEYGGLGTMSKSKNNGVDPQELIDHYGADIARFYMISTSPPEMSLVWSDEGVEGAARFMRRLWGFCFEAKSQLDTLRQAAAREPARFDQETKDFRYQIHALLRQANYDYERKQFNTVASACNKILIALEEFGGIKAYERNASKDRDVAVANEQRILGLAESVSILLRILSPIAPHVAHALWNELGFAAKHGGLLDASWPEPDATALLRDEIDLVVQINGRKRGDVRVPRDADSKAIEQIVLADPAVQRHVNGQLVKKVVVVPGRLVNVVV